jgi:hypothetical protein
VSPVVPWGAIKVFGEKGRNTRIAYVTGDDMPGEISNKDNPTADERTKIPAKEDENQ